MPSLCPGTQFGALGLECVDAASLFHGQADIVETVEQAMALEIVEIEGNRAAIGTVNFLGFEIDGEGCIGAARSVVHQLVQLFLSDLDRQDAVLEAVIVEDVGERGRDDAADTEIKQGPRRMFARGTAAEIVACNQNLSV